MMQYNLNIFYELHMKLSSMMVIFSYKELFRFPLHISCFEEECKDEEGERKEEKEKSIQQLYN